MCLPHSAWAAVAGRFQFVAGDVRIVSADGRERPAIKGGEIHEKESIFSGKTGSAQLRMIDDGIVAVRPETSLRIDEYKFANKEDGTERGFFSLLKGGFRSITGLIGRGNRDNYGIRTPSATIGIRGTDHETVHLTAALPNLPEGTYNKVNTGATAVNGTLVGANQVAYAPNLNTPASILPHIPAIFEVSKGGRQGQEDRKRSDADNGNGKPQAKDEKKQDGPRAANTNAQNRLDDTPLPPPAPNSALVTGTTGSAALASGSGALRAPIGSGGVGGDISIRTIWNGRTDITGPFASSGSILVEDPDQIILFDATTKLPVLIAEQSASGSMKYSAGRALMVDVGQATVGTAKVIWGRYVGPDQFVDSQGTRDPITMNLMFADQVMNFSQASTYFQNNPNTFDFKLVPGAGNIVDDLGATYSAIGTLSVSSTTTPLVSMAINASNGSRTWELGYKGTLQQFYQQGNCSTAFCGLPLSASATLTGSGPVSVIKGEAGGVFIAPSAAGALTSYSANAFNASGALVGSLQGTSLFRR